MPPTALALLSPVPADVVRQRAEGISVVSLGLGVPAAFRSRAPWLLGGAKTLSYAVNMAAQRHAHALGADDVVFTSVEGQLLEGPTSTVVWAAGGTLHTPPLDTGILAGTTMARLFARAADDGWPTAVTAGDRRRPARRRRGLAAVRGPGRRHRAHAGRRPARRRGPVGAGAGAARPVTSPPVRREVWSATSSADPFPRSRPVTATPTRLLGRGSWPEAQRIAAVLRRETVGGALLLVAAAVALVWANSPVGRGLRGAAGHPRRARRRCTST